MTGDLTIPDKIIHSGDTNTAIRFPSADTVTVETAGVERVRIASAGNVGIGTTSPAAKLVVSDAASPSILVIDTTNTATARIQAADNIVYFGARSNHPVEFLVNDVERMHISTAGNVGIGTATPATKLDVNGDVTITDKIIHSGDTNTAIRFPANDTFAIETNGSERVRVASGGSVGIGTTSTLGLLNVNGQVVIGSGTQFRTQIFSGGLPATGTASGLTKFVFNFTFSDTFGTALITLDLSAGLATVNFAKYIFAVKCTANSGTTAVQEGSTNNVVQIGFSSFTFAATATTRNFTVTVTRSGSENWSGFGGFKIEAVTNIRFLTLNSVTAIP